MSGGNLKPHDHKPTINTHDDNLRVVHGDTVKWVWKRGPFLRWRISRAFRVTKRRHDRGTAREHRVVGKVAAALKEIGDKS